MSIWNPDTSNFEYYYDKGKYKLAWRLSLLFSILFAIQFVVFSQISFLPSVYFGISFLVALSALVLIKMTKQYKFVFWMFTICASIIISLSFFTTPNIHYHNFIWVISIIIFAFIGLERKYGLMFVALHTIVIALFIHLKLNDHLSKLEIQSNIQLYSMTMEMVFAMFSMAYLISEYLRLQQFAEMKLSDTNDALEHQNKIIQQQNIENKTLIKEVHHRVKNNLQIIVSLLRMQKELIDSPETKHQFQDAINRILTMSLIHQKLYQENHLSEIDPNLYIKNLSNEILASSATECIVKINVKANIKSIGLKTIVPLGLMINELISNSLKHAFLTENQGTISMELKETQTGQLAFSYSDSGVWQNSTSNSNGFGGELIEILTQQLDGTYTRSDSRFEFLLKNID